MTVPKLMGYEIYTVISGSMEPTIMTGSLVYVDRSTADSVTTGDIVAYYGSGNDTGTVITHRIIGVDEEGKFITKGDNNSSEDLIPVSAYNVVGKVVFHVPFVGWIANYISTIEGKMAVGLVVIAALLFYGVSSLTDKRKQTQDSNDSNQNAAGD